MESTKVPETIGGAIPHEMITDAMRDDGFLPPNWMIGPRPQKLRQARLELGNNGYLMVEEELGDRCWVYAVLNGFSGGEFIDGSLEHGMRVLAETLRPLLVAAIALLDDYAKTEVQKQES